MTDNLFAFLKKNRRPVITTLILLLAGAAYYTFTKLTGLFIPCVFRLVTGLACPGCGISHFCADIIELDFYSAFRQNAAAAVLAAIWGITGVIYLIFRPKVLKKEGKAFKILIWGSVILLVIFGIIRNLPWFSFLLPVYMQ